jgi:hypothetical protein
MPFRWLQFFRVVWPIPFSLAALNFLHVRYELARTIGRGSLIVLVALGMAGALLAIASLFTGMRIRCPFCRRWGAGAIEKKGLPWMECESCGTIRCTGLLGLRIAKEPSGESPQKVPSKRAIRVLARLLLVAGVASLLVGILGFGSGAVLSLGGTGFIPSSLQLPFSEPEGVVVLPDGRVLTGLMFYGRVQEYDADGNYRRGWFVPATNGGHFLMRRGPDGTLEVLTIRSNTLHCFSESGELLKSTPNQPVSLRDEFRADSAGPWTDAAGRTYELRGKNFGPSIFPRVVRKDTGGIERVVAATPWYMWPFQGVFPAFLMIPAGIMAIMAAMAGLIVAKRASSAQSSSTRPPST